MDRHNYISRDLESSMIQYVCEDVLAAWPHINPENTLILNVSPDYSSILAQNLSHFLSQDGEYVSFISIDVPFPDQDSAPFRLDFKSKMIENSDYEFYILVEAGIITGGNYTFMVDHMVNHMFIPRENILTVALFENTMSKFKCDIIGANYVWTDDDPLEFYWERFNKHWENV